MTVQICDESPSMSRCSITANQYVSLNYGTGGLITKKVLIEKTKVLETYLQIAVVSECHFTISLL